jgi:hypothetical protein
MFRKKVTVSVTKERAKERDACKAEQEEVLNRLTNVEAEVSKLQEDIQEVQEVVKQRV